MRRREEEKKRKMRRREEEKKRRKEQKRREKKRRREEEKKRSSEAQKLTPPLHSTAERSRAEPSVPSLVFDLGAKHLVKKLREPTSAEVRRARSPQGLSTPLQLYIKTPDQPALPARC